MWNDTSFTRRLGLRYPIIQGPFGGGLSTVRLTAAVSNLGGLGSYGAHNLSPSEIRQLAEAIRSATPQPFALNLWVSRHDAGGDEQISTAQHEAAAAAFQPYYDALKISSAAPFQPDGWTFAEQAAAVIEARPAVFSFVFGIPEAAILEECRRHGIATLGAATTLAEAIALEAAGVDLVLASGFEAGGHRPSFLRPAEKSLMGTMALIPQVSDRLQAPVIAAGGIGDARGVAAALTLGAQAVQLGTAFLACEESGAPAAHRDRLFTPDAAETALSRHVTGRLARFMAAPILDELSARQPVPLPYPVQSWYTRPIRSAAGQGSRRELMTDYCGQAAPLLRHRKVEDLMNSLVAGVGEILR